MSFESRFGVQCHCTRVKIKTRNNDCFSTIRPTYNSYLKYPTPTSTSDYSSDVTKNLEEINFWASNHTTVLAAMIEQRLSNHSSTCPKYGYPKVNVIIGSDHGARSSKFLFRVNLVSPSKMQKLENINSQSIIFQFATITCKKDTADVISLIENQINKCIHDFKYGCLVGIKMKIPTN